MRSPFKHFAVDGPVRPSKLASSLPYAPASEPIANPVKDIGADIDIEQELSDEFESGNFEQVPLIRPNRVNTTAGELERMLEEAGIAIQALEDEISVKQALLADAQLVVKTLTPALEALVKKGDEPKGRK